MKNDELSLYIDGEWCRGTDGAVDVVDPATEESLGRLSFAGKVDIDRALTSAEQGFREWSKRLPQERAAVLHSVAALVAERADEIGRNLTQEQGKPLGEARNELLRVAESFRWCAEEATRIWGKVWPIRRAGTRHMTIKVPSGLVAAFTPWNFPATIPGRKLSAALAAGCSIILKASEQTPATAMGLVRACADGGVPPGVVNLLFGDPPAVAERLLSSPVVRNVSVTGSVAAGKAVAALAARHLSRPTLELGGHAPVIVFDDIDAAVAADAITPFKFRNAGQVCIAPSRIFVQESSFRPFIERFVENARAIRVGRGLDPDVQMGPLANARRLAAMEELVADARARGGKVLTGGARIGNRGFFFAPTVVTDIPDDSRLMAEEPFGPVAPVVSFRNSDEVIERANAVPLGLAAYAFTRSSARAAAMTEGLEAGLVCVNTFTGVLSDAPFGGMKESGYGYEGGIEGIEAFMQTRLVIHDTTFEGAR
jgi:succinate-semialdehyde dehydrogenase / glutarate-semialdehyde dehydrogenase